VAAGKKRGRGSCLPPSPSPQQKTCEEEGEKEGTLLIVVVEMTSGGHPPEPESVREGRHLP
jgi:hypothetical protein